jgi:sugar transferase EpsL
VKRLFDIICSFGALVVLAPVLIVVALLVRWKLGSPVIFSQLRPGHLGQIFRMYKFRTMTNAVGPDGAPLSDEIRLTSFGRFLRASSLDEMPELWNVLVGNMSFVGPRPLLVEYLQLYTNQQARRHEVKPGITGWAQVNGRNAISWEQKFIYDVWYVDNQSMWLDIKILFLTAKKVLGAKDIAHGGDATMPRFAGTKK